MQESEPLPAEPVKVQVEQVDPPGEGVLDAVVEQVYPNGMYACPQAVQELEEQSGPAVPLAAPMTLAHWELLPQVQFA